MANGILIVDKPQGWTSMDVCAKLRGVFHERRVGHAGTLDPMATGVLPVFIGRATRAVEFAAGADKEYIAALRLGVTTNTQDATGEVTETHPVTVTQADLEAVLPRFRGDILQVPPMFSAVKRDGKKLYELARKGREVERDPRPVTIHTLEVLRPLGEDGYELRVACSKGTYVRTLCHDIGQALGCGGCMSALRRIRAAGFSLEDALSLERVREAADPSALLLPVESLFADRPELPLGAAAEKKVRNGASVSLPDVPGGEYRLRGQGGEFLALGCVKGGTLTVIKSFFEV